ncbi:MAG: YkvA family protein [Pseudomonadota bacterium]|nr:YkvA family protein [Pseudomonadota bacterium]
MNATQLHSSLTYPHGFLDFLTMTPKRGHRIGDYALQAEGLERFNGALRALSPESPSLTLDQMASAAQRALDRYAEGGQPAFVTARMSALARLESMADDPGWAPDDVLRQHLHVLQAYVLSTDDLIPDRLPVVGRLDDAVLIDVGLQLVREDLAEYEDFCRFRRVAADFAGITVEETGLTRNHWLEAITQSRDSRTPRYGRARTRFAPDPRSTLFHVT